MDTQDRFEKDQWLNQLQVRNEIEKLEGNFAIRLAKRVRRAYIKNKVNRLCWGAEGSFERASDNLITVKGERSSEGITVQATGQGAPRFIGDGRFEMTVKVDRGTGGSITDITADMEEFRIRGAEPIASHFSLDGLIEDNSLPIQDIFAVLECVPHSALR